MMEMFKLVGGPFDGHEVTRWPGTFAVFFPFEDGQRCFRILYAVGAVTHFQNENGVEKMLATYVPDEEFDAWYKEREERRKQNEEDGA